jgi:hypothetical protein
MRYLIVFIFAVMLVGCGKKDIPPPPTAHALLVKNLFKNLAKQKHGAAVKRIQKVRALDNSNEFLIQLEEREFCNIYITQAQKQLDANKISQALTTIVLARKTYPLNRNLLAIQTELIQLSGLQKYIKLLNSASSSREMNVQINAVSKFIKKYPEGKILSPLLRKKIVRAFKQKLYEQERARFDVLCELKAARSAERPDQMVNDTLLAVLATANAATINPKERVKADLLD